jgi:hypothetical protein
MKRFINFYQKDRQFIKMINQSNKGFELIFIDNKTFKNFLELINKYENNNDEIYIIWQMKFKLKNYILYNKCTFSEPIDNYFKDKLCGKKIEVKCSESSINTDSDIYKNTINRKTKEKYNDAILLHRMLKINQLNLKSEN